MTMQPEQQTDELEPTDVIVRVEEYEQLRHAAAKVVERYWDEAREHFYTSAGKGPATNHVFHSLVTLKRFAEGK